MEMARYYEASIWTDCPAGKWHFPNMTERDVLPPWQTMPQPSTRAALVLSTVGCDWREERDA